MRHGLSPNSSFRPAVESLEDRAVPANVGTATQNFVDQLYRDILHRAPDPAAAGWVNALNGGQMDREDVVDGILESPEGLRNQINDLYVRFLGRTVDPTGLSGWSNFLRNRDNTNLDLAAQLIGSQEYYQTRGGGTDVGFLNAVYRDVLGRPINPNEAEDRDDDFDDRIDVAESILESDEAEDARGVFSARSFLRTTVPLNQGDQFADDDDDAAFARTLLFGDQYFNVSQRLATTDFATIPSSNNVAARPIV